MLWIIVFGSVALAGLVLVIAYGVWLAHKAADLLSEVSVLTERGGELLELVGQIRVPPADLGADPPSPRAGPDPINVQSNDVG